MILFYILILKIYVIYYIYDIVIIININRFFEVIYRIFVYLIL